MTFDMLNLIVLLLFGSKQNRGSGSDTLARQTSVDLAWASVQVSKNQWKTSASNQPETGEQLDGQGYQPEINTNASANEANVSGEQLQERRSSSESSHTPGQSVAPAQMLSNDQCISAIEQTGSSNKVSTNRPTSRSSRPQALRRQSDSQGSDLSEPLDNSLSLSSPDYLRSPRQSADSDILGLRTCRFFLPFASLNFD